jgi:dTMP kinase
MIQQEPDLTLLIDIDPYTGHSRAKARETKEERFEDFGVALQEKMRAGFIKLAKEFSDRINIIDGNQNINSVQKMVYDLVKGALK